MVLATASCVVDPNAEIDSPETVCPAGISFVESELTLPLGRKAFMGLNYPSNCHVTWTVDDQSVLALDGDGNRVRARRIGQTTVHAFGGYGIDGPEDHCLVTVVPNSIAELTITQHFLEMLEGHYSPSTLMVEMLDGEGRQFYPISEITWSSSDPSVAEITFSFINPGGWASASVWPRNAGSAVVTASYSGSGADGITFSDSCIVEVVVAEP